MTVSSSAHGFVRGALFSLSVLLLASGIAHAAIPATERQALLDLYASTNGASWTTKTNWNGAAGTECTWYGVECNVPPTTVTGITLNSNHLVGSLPATVGNLGNLRYLDLNSNQLTGTIPSFATNRALVLLQLTDNQLTGSIPSFAASGALMRVALEVNQLSGPIPSFAANPGLAELRLVGNQLTGPIPSFAANPGLRELWLANNRLSGPIPSFAANPGLRWLWLSYNQLSGPTPSFAANPALELLLLSSNQLTGPVDPSLGTLTNLSAGGGLDLRWNGLTSTDPALVAFLNAKQDGGDWQSTQTIPVTGLGVSGITGSQATVNWTPITYTADSGSYQVFTSTVSGGPYTPFATVTANKSATSLTVTGLTPGTPYFLRVQTTTAPHAANQNTVLSGYSAELRATTSGALPAVAVPATGLTSLLVLAGLLAGMSALRIAKGSW